MPDADATFAVWEYLITVDDEVRIRLSQTSCSVFLLTLQVDLFWVCACQQYNLFRALIDNTVLKIILDQMSIFRGKWRPFASS